MVILYQVVILLETSKDFMSRFGIYTSLQGAKDAVEEFWFDDQGELISNGVYIEEVKVDTIPIPFKRQGKKICYINDYGAWLSY